jgi:hypothetical protein
MEIRWLYERMRSFAPCVTVESCLSASYSLVRFLARKDDLSEFSGFKVDSNNLDSRTS